MKKYTFLLKTVSLFLIFVLSASVLVSCKNDGGSDDNNAQNGDLYDLSDFKIVRSDSAGDDVISYVAKVKNAIKDTVGPELSVGIDADTEEGGKEILIGNTNRKESSDALAYLEGKTDKDAWVIEINDDKIIIAGTTDKATVRAVKIFIESYVEVSPKGTGIDISAGTLLASPYDEENVIWASNGVEFDVEINSTICEPSDKVNTSFFGSPLLISNTQYPSVTELCYQSNADDNGKLIATFNMSATDPTGKTGATNTCVAMSADGGKSWKCIARPEEKINPSLTPGAMAHIYELPAQVGDMPAGTLLYSSVSWDYKTTTNISVWRSFDCGYTWEQYVCIDSAGAEGEGVWEPFMIYSEEDKYLYCFYSDDSDPDHDQKVVYKRSKDGIAWEGEGGKIGESGKNGTDVEPVEVVAYKDYDYRAGMPVITKMGNGEYFLVFELFGDWSSAPIYCKTTKDLSDWGDPNDYGTLIKSKEVARMTGAPSCAWIDAGGECGTLVVTAKSTGEKIFVSFDYGKTWEVIENPLSYYEFASKSGRVGYSAGLWVGKDKKTLYYVNAINAASDPDNRRMIAFAKIKIY